MTSGGAESSVSSSGGGDDYNKIADALVDLFVYAPLGFALDAKKLLPELASRGRDQVKLLRVLSKFAAPVMKQRGEAFLKDPLSTIAGATKAQGGTTKKAPAAPVAQPASSPVGEETHLDPSKGPAAQVSPGKKANTSTAPKSGRAASAPAAKPSAAAKKAPGAVKKAPGAAKRATSSTTANSAATRGAKADQIAAPATSTSKSKVRAPKGPLTVPIEGYDALPASAIVEMVDRLTRKEQVAVEAYERANRGRRTVLGKLAQVANP